MAIGVASIALLGVAVWLLDSVAQGPIWPLLLSGFAGTIAGLAWARNDFRLPRDGWRRRIPFLISYLVIFLSEKVIIWLTHQRDSFSFFIAYVLAMLAGLFLGFVLLGWSALAKPRAATP